MSSVRASNLEFITRLRSDGTGADPLTEQHLAFLLKYDDLFNLHPLSITEKTFIAFNMSVYTVKIKEHEPNT